MFPSVKIISAKVCNHFDSIHLMNELKLYVIRYCLATLCMMLIVNLVIVFYDIHEGVIIRSLPLGHHSLFALGF